MIGGWVMRGALALVVAVALSVTLGVSHAADRQEGVILDALGSATPGTSFSIYASGGTAISSTQAVGPRFVLAQPTTITEVGAFVNSGTPGAKPFLVEILAARADGFPDRSAVLGHAKLRGDYDPREINFVSADLNVRLPAGAYFALISPERGEDGGVLLGTATDPFPYQAQSITLGFATPEGNIPSGYLPAAVRILGIAMEPGD